MECDAVVFDLFGTLIDTFSPEEYRLALTEMADVLGAPSEEFVRLWLETVEQRMIGEFPTVEAGVRHICELLGVQADPDDLAAAAEIRVDFTRRNLIPRPDTLPVLRLLRKGGRRIGLITDCTLEVPMLWKQTPFSALMDAVVFSCTARIKKPDPAIYRLACQGLDVAPEHCVYVGDGSSGELTGASRVGMHPVLLRVPYEDLHEWERVEAESWPGPTISTLSGILTLID
jgi:putative hydrolase of the HAD superfamily